MVAFALAAQTNPSARRALTRELEHRPYGFATDGRTVWWDNWFTLTGAGPVGTVGGPTTDGTRAGATLGLQLAERTEPHHLHADWNRWLAPDSTADDLVDAFDLEPLSTPRDLAHEAGFDWTPDLARMVHADCT